MSASPAALPHDTRLYEYASAATPTLPGIPYVVLAPPAPSTTGRVLWDNRQALGMAHPGTTPSLACHHVTVHTEAPLQFQDACTSSVIRIQRGQGRITLTAHGEQPEVSVAYGPGDVVVLPGLGAVTWAATELTQATLVSDAPLLAYLGVEPRERRITAIHYREADLLAAIAHYRAEQAAANRNRCGVILGQTATADTKTASRTLWALLNILPANTVQKPHRHQSVAIDIAVSGGEGVYTLMSPQLRADGSLVDPIKAPWVPGAAFLTPPGWWHSHHNETNREAMVFPVQDAGLHTHLRTLDIQFVR